MINCPILRAVLRYLKGHNCGPWRFMCLIPRPVSWLKPSLPCNHSFSIPAIVQAVGDMSLPLANTTTPAQKRRGQRLTTQLNELQDPAAQLEAVLAS